MDSGAKISQTIHSFPNDDAWASLGWGVTQGNGGLEGSFHLEVSEVMGVPQ
jgi:hypothetical protein